MPVGEVAIAQGLFGILADDLATSTKTQEVRMSVTGCWAYQSQLRRKRSSSRLNPAGLRNSTNSLVRWQSESPSIAISEGGGSDVISDE